MAAWVAARTGSGTGKCGWPMLRLTGSLRLRPSSKIFRTPDISMPRARTAIQWSVMSPLQRGAGFSAHLLDQLVQGVLDFAHALGPLVGVERQAAVDQLAQRPGGGGVALADRLELPVPEFRVQVHLAVGDGRGGVAEGGQPVHRRAEVE